MRLVASGLASPAAVKRAAFAAFGVAALAGLALAAVAARRGCSSSGRRPSPPGWFYTGGPKPYGYYGFGELFVFVFFGLVATAGSTYVQIERITGLSRRRPAPRSASLACALLVVNNLRDIPTDGRPARGPWPCASVTDATRQLYTFLVALAFAGALVCAGRWRWPAALTVGAVPLAFGPVGKVRAGAAGRELIAVLAATGRLQLGFGALLTVGLVLGS